MLKLSKYIHTTKIGNNHYIFNLNNGAMLALDQETNNKVIDFKKNHNVKIFFKK